MSFLSGKPFNLNAMQLDWVSRTFASLSDEARVAQLFVLALFGPDPAADGRIARLKPGGVTRFFGPDAGYEAALLEQLQAEAEVPLLISADLEGSRMSLPFGTQVPNPLALAAVDDLSATREVSRIMAEEAVALGINWSFTPVLDISAAFRSAIVATRGFGSNVEKIRQHALVQAAVFQAHGIAATVKHWPGEGFDDRDQHLVTTVNPLSLEDWEAHFGTLYRAAIDAGVMSVMSAHIAFPAFVRSLDPQAGLEAFRPASLSKVLNFELLRKRLGFNGLIVSDATAMAGLTSWAGAQASKPQLIEAGCDVILFSDDPEAEMAAVLAAVKSGAIARQRFDDAVLRVLGMKAALGLHDRAARKGELGAAANRKVAREIIARAPTLVKDVRGLLPIATAKTRRVLVYATGIISPVHPVKEFVLPQMIRDEGFVVTVFSPGTEVSAAEFDLVLYLFGEETLLTRNRIFLDWAKMHGSFRDAMRRHWHEIPTVMISFGYPYYLYDAPRVPAYINAYCTLDDMQAAVVDCLMGRREWNTHNPVDPFCGLEDARF